MLGDKRLAVAGCLVMLLAGCDQLGLEDPAKIALRVEAEGKAIGGACRHAARAIEDCYELNPRASKSAVFDGWREMNDYMLQNKIEPIIPTIPRVHKDVPAEEKAKPVEEAKPAPEPQAEVKEEKKEEMIVEEVKEKKPSKRSRRKRAEKVEEKAAEKPAEVAPPAAATDAHKK